MLATQPLQPTLGVAREKDGGSLRALCQVCSPSGEIMDSRKACVLVTIYRRESDLFALLLRERHDDLGNLGGGGGGAVSNAPGSVLCDVTVDDAVHLEPQSSPLVVKVVNTRVGGDVRAYVLEFGRAVDLMTFQRGFTAARGYFRQMLTLRTLVSDSFWQGFASGAGGPVRNDPLAPPTLALEPPPGAPGQPYPGLRDKQTGPGAGGVNPEDLAAAVGQWSTEAMLPATTLHPSGWAPSPRARPRVPSTPTPKSSRQRSAAVASSKKNNGIALVGQVAPSPRVDKAAAAASGNAGSIDGKSGLVTFTRSNRANRGNTASVIYLLEWPYPDAGSAAEKAANKSHNLTMVEAETSCHRCHSGKERLREGV